MMIRPATPDDVPSVLPMVQKICAFHEKLDPAKFGFLPDVASRYDGWLRGRAADASSVFLVAQREATAQKPTHLVGFLIGTVEREIPIYRLEKMGFVHDLWVDEDYRHEGIARQLVMMAIERFTLIGVAQVRLDVAVANEPARNLFKSCGLRESVVEMLLEIRP